MYVGGGGGLCEWLYIHVGVCMHTHHPHIHDCDCVFTVSLHVGVVITSRCRL